jgi:hypothetical protein
MESSNSEWPEIIMTLHLCFRLLFVSFLHRSNHLHHCHIDSNPPKHCIQLLEMGGGGGVIEQSMDVPGTTVVVVALCLLWLCAASLSADQLSLWHMQYSRMTQPNFIASLAACLTD